MAEARRFELRLGVTPLSVFKTDPFSRLGTPPGQAKLLPLARPLSMTTQVKRPKLIGESALTKTFVKQRSFIRNIKDFPTSCGRIAARALGRHRIIIDKCKTLEKCRFYIRSTIESHLSRNDLESRILFQK